ncbi:OmpA family protein, partial [Ralstonia insidiosa]|uniref:OmpA family protein n=1 Tax=Ralstonia insidiosa TaxID=190721 RepID=UPI000CEF5223
MQRFCIAALAIAIALGVSPTHAQSLRPAASEMIERLQVRPGTRSLTERGVEIVEAAPPSIDLDVPFAFNSARLESDARDVLDELGKALVSNELQNSRFAIEGHTDVRGSDRYNQRLSEERARMVVQFLEQRYRIPAKRLVVAGYGSSRLKNQAQPDAAENR